MPTGFPDQSLFFCETYIIWVHILIQLFLLYFWTVGHFKKKLILGMLVVGTVEKQLKLLCQLYTLSVIRDM